jgi:hypothetical protein
MISFVMDIREMGLAVRPKLSRRVQRVKRQLWGGA